MQGTTIQNVSLVTSLRKAQPLLRRFARSSQTLSSITCTYLRTVLHKPAINADES